MHWTSRQISYKKKKRSKNHIGFHLCQPWTVIWDYNGHSFTKLDNGGLEKCCLIWSHFHADGGVRIRYQQHEFMDMTCFVSSLTCWRWYNGELSVFLEQTGPIHCKQALLECFNLSEYSCWTYACLYSYISPPCIMTSSSMIIHHVTKLPQTDFINMAVGSVASNVTRSESDLRTASLRCTTEWMCSWQILLNILDTFTWFISFKQSFECYTRE